MILISCIFILLLRYFVSDCWPSSLESLNDTRNGQQPATLGVQRFEREMLWRPCCCVKRIHKDV